MCAALLSAYGDPARGYHDARHLTEVLDRIDDLLPGGTASLTLVLAAWFHDAVYDGERDAEERSAQWAEAELTAAGLDAATVAEVARLVRLTETHEPAPHDTQGAALCDADLAILAADEQRYAEYVAGVRREFSHLDDAAFASGRAAVLRSLLAGDLFHTAQGRARWEASARAQVTAELARLSSAATT